ncbi:hypothetical protein LTR53_002034 [Teratosphaeriaceae sp. CCFEE 6253]|nr:hypothetical protein LTR53_002034 [Teratosphaeriaceae sp. CCFEE 6253]
MVSSDKNSLAHENGKIRAVLAAHSIDTQVDVMSLSTPADLSSLGSTAVDIRFDPQIGQERVFLDFDESMEDAWTSSDTSQVRNDSDQAGLSALKNPVVGDSWAALDFILALEWPCRDHVKHHAINPDANVPKACDVGGFHGHALTTTQAVYQSALPPSGISHERAAIAGSEMPMQNGLHPSTMVKWQLPHSEIDKLVELSELLHLDDEQMTPAMAYSAIRQEVPGDEYLKPVLEALKLPLSILAKCSGFGAWVGATDFYQRLDEAVGGLKRVPAS